MTPTPLGVATLLVTVLAMTAPHSAAAAILLSGDGTEACRIQPFVASNPGNCPVVIIAPSPEWFAAADGAEWVSFADTGDGGAVTVPSPANPLSAVMQIAEPFTTAGNETLVLDVWASTTANVSLQTGFFGFSSTGSGFTFIPPDLFDADNTDCTLNIPGCVTAGRGVFFFEDPGSYALFFSVFQTADNEPFGLRYRGELLAGNHVAPVPEPATLLLFGAGLAAVARKVRQQGQ